MYAQSDIERRDSTRLQTSPESSAHHGMPRRTPILAWRRGAPAVFWALLTIAGIGPGSGAQATVWGIKTTGPVSQPPSTLFQFEEDGSVLTAIGQIRLEGAPVDADGLALSDSGLLVAFVIETTGSRLVSVGPTTAQASVLGPLLAGRDCRGATFAEDGRLLVLDSGRDEVVSVSEVTGEVLGDPIALTQDGGPFDLGDLCDIVPIDEDRFLLSSVRDYYELDFATGAVTFVFTDLVPADDGSAPAAAGLAFASVEPGDPSLFVYDVLFDDDIFLYENTESWTRTLVFDDIIPQHNAGRGDLAAAPRGASDIGIGDLPSATPGLELAGPFPNPARTASVRLSSERDGPVDLAIYDPSGRCVMRSQSTTCSAGEPRLVRLDATGLAPGLYFVRARTRDGGTASVPWIVLR